MTHSNVMFVLSLSLSLSACAIPGLAGGGVFAVPSSGHAAPPAAARSQPPPASSSSSSSASDDAIREQQSRDEHARLDQQELAYEHSRNPNWDVPPETIEAERDLETARTQTNHEHMSGKTLTDDATQCASYVQAQRAAGKPDQAIVQIRTQAGKMPMSLAAVDRKICQPLLALGQTWDELGKQERASEQAKEQAPLRAVGITGAKLEWLAGREFPLTTLGEREVEGPAEAKRVSVYFILLGEDARGYELERYEFTANGHLHKTVEGFLVRPGRDKYR